jgi:segregation and condensation protein B
MNPEKIRNIIEAVVFSSAAPVTMDALVKVIDELDRDQLNVIVESMLNDWRSQNRGFQLVEVAGGLQFRTRPEFSAWMHRIQDDSKPTKLTRASLETLSIIAYKQPITRPEIEDLRGVDSGGVTKNLLDRNLIKIIGRKDAPGKPVVYGTTTRFLEVFSLRDLGSLPSLRDLRELEDDDGEQLALPTVKAVGDEGAEATEEEVVVVTDSERRRQIRENVRQALGAMPILPANPLEAEDGLPDALPDDDHVLIELEQALKRRKEVAERTEAILDGAEQEYVDKVTAGKFDGEDDIDPDSAPEDVAGTSASEFPEPESPEFESSELESDESDESARSYESGESDDSDEFEDSASDAFETATPELDADEESLSAPAPELASESDSPYEAASYESESAYAASSESETDSADSVTDSAHEQEAPSEADFDAESATEDGEAKPSDEENEIV